MCISCFSCSDVLLVSYLIPFDDFDLFCFAIWKTILLVIAVTYDRRWWDWILVLRDCADCNEYQIKIHIMYLFFLGGFQFRIDVTSKLSWFPLVSRGFCMSARFMLCLFDNSPCSCYLLPRIILRRSLLH